MKWKDLSVDGEVGINDGLVCAGCSNVIYDFAFFPKDWDSPEAEVLANAVKANNLFMESSDPYTFVFCNECKNSGGVRSEQHSTL